MLRNPFVIWSVVLAAGVVAKVQVDHHREHVGADAPLPVAIIEYTEADPLADRVKIFGREYERPELESWYTRVESGYRVWKGRVYPAGYLVGSPMSYREFVAALQTGHYFPELRSEGVLSDGERPILIY